jgi:lipoate-protein ligase A
MKELVPNTLHLYRRKPSAVSIGRYQKIEDVVDTKYCKARRIDILRRISGGGPIYTDSNCLEYSVVVDREYSKIPIDLEGSFKVICTGIIKALDTLGLNAYYKPINDVIVEGKKISGSAQRRSGHILLQHGTLLCDADLDLMSKALKMGHEGVRKLEEKLTTIRWEANRVIDIEKASEALKRGFEEVLSMKLVKSKLIPWEELKIKELADKYRSKTWVFSNQH